MRYLKTYEEKEEIIFSVGDIIVYNGNPYGADNKKNTNERPNYGKKYTIERIDLRGYSVENITKEDLWNAFFDIKDIETEKIIKGWPTYVFIQSWEWDANKKYNL
jgi:hypothetical protein